MSWVKGGGAASSCGQGCDPGEGGRLLGEWPPRLEGPALCVSLFPGNDWSWDLSFLAASKLKTGSPLVWQEMFEAVAKTSVSFSLATRGVLREILKA